MLILKLIINKSQLKWNEIIIEERKEESCGVEEIPFFFSWENKEV